MTFMLSARFEFDSQRIATLWLDSPGKRVNTLSRQMWTDLSEAIAQAEREKPVGLIITSAKPGTFCVGADLYEMRGMSDEEFDQYIRTGQEILNRLENLPMPTIAAINGDCLGGGLELALACKIRLLEDGNASIGLPELRLGLIPGWGGTFRLSRLIGTSAIKLILDSTLLNPAAARDAHVVDDVLASAEFGNLTRKLLMDLKYSPLPAQRMQFGHAKEFEPALQAVHPSSPAAAKLIEIIRAGLHNKAQAAFDAERHAIIELRRAPECQKALKEFLDRKKS